MMTTDAVGGVWTYSTALAGELVKSGLEVHLLTMGRPPRDDQRAMLDGRVQLIESDLALEWQDPEGNDVPHARRALSNFERAVEPDIIHLNGFREAALQWNAPVLVAVHSCVSSWARACDDSTWLSDAKWQRYTRAVFAGLSTANSWVAPSHAFRDVISSLYRPSSPGSVIWNGIGPGAAPARQKDSLFLGAGRMWDKAKNLSLLARASEALDWPVLVAGPIEATSTGSPGAIQFLGDLPQITLRSYMQCAEIFVSPALYEPFGLSVLEAASAGCALVLSDIPSFRELWDDAAVFVDPSDARELHNALASICRDHAGRRQLQLSARERSLRYSLAHTACAYRKLYRRVLCATSVTPSALEVHA
jgi:glycosyltransferase involved in cell wall biosynthesis